MAALPPSLSAKLSSEVYSLVERELSDAIALFKHRIGDIFHVGAGSVSLGVTGSLGIIKCKSAFGLFLLGKGAFEGHAVFVFRGTFVGIDWLTNLNISVSKSSFGQNVHDGFAETFATIRPRLSPIINALAKNKVHSVHCIGHSLGGAVATMCAEYIRSATSYIPYLYTFGAPRVGLEPFANMLTSQLKPQRMFRVYHRTDIVPCIPFWPFVHAPTFLGSSYDYYQPSPGVFPTDTWHDKDRYVKTIGSKNWPALRAHCQERYSDSKILAWLNRDGPVNFSFTQLEWLDKAMNFVISKCLDRAGAALTCGFGSTFTIMDRLAYVLKQGVDLSKSVSGLVLALLKKVMSMLGMSRTVEAIDATQDFIRSLFMKLYERISQECKKILSRALADGIGR